MENATHDLHPQELDDKNRKLLVYYYDDQIDQALTGGQRYKELIDKHPYLDCTLSPPPQWEELDEIDAHPPQLFLIDYELSMIQEDHRSVNYRGSTLAAELRARFPDLPIALITNENVWAGLGIATQRQLKDHKPDFDILILKNEFEEKRVETREMIYRLAKGFQDLNNIPKTWLSLCNAMGAQPEEIDMLQEASPPLLREQWVVVEGAEWIRNTILRFPGILYNAVHAATHLGISVDAFLQSGVQEMFQEAAYDGVFEPTEGRWWRKRLVAIAQHLASEQQVSGPVNQAFRLAYQKSKETELDPAICIWDGTLVADWVCCFLDEPVKLKHTLRYYPDYPDQRPAVMDEARISYRALIEEEIDENLVDPDEQAMIDDIRQMPDPRSS